MKEREGERRRKKEAEDLHLSNIGGICIIAATNKEENCTLQEEQELFSKL